MTAPAAPTRSSALDAANHEGVRSPVPTAALPSDRFPSGPRWPRTRTRTHADAATADAASAGESLHVLAARALLAFRALQRAESQLARAQGACLLRALDRRLHIRAGFARFTDFTREVLQQAPRTTKRRIALHRTLAESPQLEHAFDTHRLTPCRVLALRPLSGHPALPFWIELAGALPVRELHRRVRDEVTRMSTAMGPEAPAARVPSCAQTGADPDEDPGIRITFAAPLSAAVAWDQALEMARRVLGWEAPPHLCVEALLAEVTTDLAPHFPPDPRDPEADPPDGTPRRHAVSGPGRPPDEAAGAAPTPCSPAPCRLPARAVPPMAIRHLRATVARTERELRRVHRLAVDSSGGDPGSELDSQALLRRTRALGRLERPLRLLQARLLLAMLEADAVGTLGHDSLAAFAEDALGLAPRTARRLLAQAFLLEDRPALARAFARGRIGAGQAFLLNRIALDSTLPAFLRRARRITHLALEREIRFLERLREILPSVASRFRGPLPMPGLEAAMWGALADRGWGLETVRARIRARGLATPEADASQDPARNPLLLRRFEALLEFVVHADAEHDAHDGHHSDPPSRPTMAPGPRLTTVTFWAPASLHRHWSACLAALRARRGPVPTWAAATWIADLALHQWERTDPDRKPATASILQRDEYRCQAPGCSARRHLEVHHVRFRSQLGSDAPSNLLTLCATHHRHVVHPGWLRVSGTAPGGLCWDRWVS